MVYCDKCKNHPVDRSIQGRNADMALGPFSIDLCAYCYNEFRKLVREWIKNDMWAEFDQHRHNNEGAAILHRVDLK